MTKEGGLVVLGWMRSLLNFFGSPAGNLVLAIVGLLATPFVDRLLIRRKRISFRVLYNSKIGLDAGRLHDDADSNNPAAPQVHSLMRLLDQLSIVVIRIRNNGSYDIDPDDFERPLSFTFGQRVVWNARISEAGSPQERERIRNGLQFFRNDTNPPASGQHTPGSTGQGRPTDRDNLRTVRDRLAYRISRFVVGQPTTTTEDSSEPTWHGVRLDGLTLRRRQKFKLVVVLREPGSGNGTGDISKEYGYSGKLRDNGLLKNESEERRFTLPRVTGGLAVLLTVLLVLTLAFAPAKTDPNIKCGSGDLHIQGSSVVIPTIRVIAADYMSQCPQAHLDAIESGSLNGVRAVTEHRADIALSDGQRHEGEGLHKQPLAIVDYDVVVHKSAGVVALTTKQLRDIFSNGTITDWSQVPGGAPLPIRIISRGGGSGSREVFENNVLHTSEGVLSSDDCKTRDRDPAAKIIRCERDPTADVAQIVSHTAGAIGYVDTGSIHKDPGTGDMTALVLDGRIPDLSANIETGYPFWTVEYVYTSTSPAPGTLLDDFIKYLYEHDSARVRLSDAGYRPCREKDGTFVELCNHR